MDADATLSFEDELHSQLLKRALDVAQRPFKRHRRSSFEFGDCPAAHQTEVRELLLRKL